MLSAAFLRDAKSWFQVETLLQQGWMYGRQSPELCSTLHVTMVFLELFNLPVYPNIHQNLRGFLILSDTFLYSVSSAWC